MYMLKGMDYQSGKAYMKDICRDGQQGEFRAYDNIIINYPGYKLNGDYRLEIEGGRAPKHEEICGRLYNKIKNAESTFEELDLLLKMVYDHGTTQLVEDEELRYLQCLIYWVTLQEEINYPRELNYSGINLAFCRFFEAIYCTKDNLFTIQDVYNRCNNHGCAKPKLYSIIDAPFYYVY